MGFFSKSIFSLFVPQHTFKTLKHINILILIVLFNYVLEMTMFVLGMLYKLQLCDFHWIYETSGS